MELRKHRRMRWQGRPNWPPSWIGSQARNDAQPAGEVGILTRVEQGFKSVSAPHCFLSTRLNNQEYCGWLFFDDEAFSQEIFETFRAHLGSPLSKIGSLDLTELECSPDTP